MAESSSSLFAAVEAFFSIKGGVVGLYIRVVREIKILILIVVDAKKNLFSI
jgi:hypothetical protein